jgi:predicted aldo/keto reductase-like oxidoreductase
MVSRLGFGGIPIQRRDEDGAVEVVKRCLDLGITFIDTANAYTTSEERIGRAIMGRREELVIATKSGARTREGVEEHLELSLKRLGVEYIDLYQFHGVSDAEALEKVLDINGPMAAAQDALRKGRIKHIGITSHSRDIAIEAVKTDKFETIMFPLNFITNEAEEDLLPLARQHDVGYIAMKPLGGGMLDNVSVAFKYLLQFPDVEILTGFEKIEEVEEICTLLEGPLEFTTKEIEAMQNLKEELGTRFCRRCGYCQPCSVNISIPAVMTSASYAKRNAPEKLFAGSFATRMEEALNCVECGVCEERCPYHLPIKETVTTQAQWYQQLKRQYQEQGML